MTELCTCWLKLGDYETWCALLEDHDGPCLPKRSEAMNAAVRFEERARELYAEVERIDALGGWPYEGPEEERP